MTFFGNRRKANKITLQKSVALRLVEYSLVKMTGIVSPASSSDKIAFLSTKLVFYKLPAVSLTLETL